MTQPRVRAPLLRAAGFGAAALLLAVAACETPGPVHPSPMSVSMAPARKEASSGAVAMRSNVRISRAAIEEAVRRHYPEVFSAGPADEAHLLFVLDPAGQVERHERLMERTQRPGSPDESVVRGAREVETMSRGQAESQVVDVLSFAPGEMGAGRVEVVWVRELSQEEMEEMRAARAEVERTAAAREREAAGTLRERRTADEMEMMRAREQVERTAAPRKREAAGSLRERQAAEEQQVMRARQQAERAAATRERETAGSLRERQAAEEMQITRARREAERASGEQRRERGAFRGGGQERGSQVRAEMVAELIARYMPAVAANGTSAEFVWFIVGADGRVLRHGDSRDSRPLNARGADAYARIETFQGDDIVVNGHPVPVVWAQLKA